MASNIYKTLIPQNSEGLMTNTESSTLLNNEKEAGQFYETVKKRLSNINQWHEMAGKATADFRLYDQERNRVFRPVEIKDYFQIDIPGPGSETGNDKDWVQVQSIQEINEKEIQAMAIIVHPVPNPLNKKTNTAHFFHPDSSSTFMVRREKNKVTVSVYGRNEKANTDNDSFTDKVRNTAVAIGAMLGFSKIQWKSLTKGLLEKK